MSTRKKAPVEITLGGYMEMKRNPLETVQTVYTSLLIIFQLVQELGGLRLGDSLFFPFCLLTFASLEENNQFADSLNIVSESSTRLRYCAVSLTAIAILSFVFLSEIMNYSRIQEFKNIYSSHLSSKVRHCHQLVGH